MISQGFVVRSVTLLSRFVSFSPRTNKRVLRFRTSGPTQDTANYLYYRDILSRKSFLTRGWAPDGPLFTMGWDRPKLEIVFLVWSTLIERKKKFGNPSEFWWHRRFNSTNYSIIARDICTVTQEIALFEHYLLYDLIARQWPPRRSDFGRQSLVTAKFGLSNELTEHRTFTLTWRIKRRNRGEEEELSLGSEGWGVVRSRVRRSRNE